MQILMRWVDFGVQQRFLPEAGYGICSTVKAKLSGFIFQRMKGILFDACKTDVNHSKSNAKMASAKKTG